MGEKSNIAGRSPAENGNKQSKATAMSNNKKYHTTIFLLLDMFVYPNGYLRARAQATRNPLQAVSCTLTGCGEHALHSPAK